MNPFYFGGLNIIESPVRMEPKLKLSESCPCTDAFREEFNAWLVEMFGERDINPIPPGVAYMFGGNVIMRPEQVALIRNLL